MRLMSEDRKQLIACLGALKRQRLAVAQRIEELEQLLETLEAAEDGLDSATAVSDARALPHQSEHQHGVGEL